MPVTETRQVTRNVPVTHTEQVTHMMPVQTVQYAPPMNYGPSSVTVVRSKVDQHHEFFVSELQSDISELRSRQRDFGAL